jgi:adenosylmethionine-8-amino-7-oxononanoate aminotransferase
MKGEPKRRKFIARERSWHGNTLGALGVSGFLERRVAFEGAFIDAIRISPANAYRPIAGATAETTGDACAHELEQAILREGPEHIAAFIFEPVVGAAGGCVPAPRGYARRVREICDRYGILMIADEVMCGAGRCGTWRALEFDGVEPDIMSVAKGLAAGYMPLGAAIYSDRVHSVRPYSELCCRCCRAADRKALSIGGARRRQRTKTQSHARRCAVRNRCDWRYPGPRPLHRCRTGQGQRNQESIQR